MYTPAQRCAGLALSLNWKGIADKSKPAKPLGNTGSQIPRFFPIRFGWHWV
jgi:hypothetical protein